MKLEKIKYERNFEIAPYIHERIGAEAFLEEGENEEDAMRCLKAFVHSMKSLSLYGNEINTSTPESLPEIKVEKKEESGLANYNGIVNSKTIQELRTFRLVAYGHPQLLEAYNQKHKELTNG